ncbi:NrfD/PsrC family molybdoenzyme membrane anchor subunit [Helicobacter winghamensis]|uniref:Polysulfide reductase n=1 Tax=Helicobacter winghamensis TaxID=157268 RepID=A0A2N3PLL6_9HELI|nr:NrfD/PsrC family molybdoenzyme membrane anchor subunit [Helicobacter winghamensis]EEO26399.1 polysulfide reductase, NrfD [Helicobacter winghamensis ATCC BAA-430]PKT75157.1 polysulfide reductase [Helicobacter winghamensis]PKT75232.1 polysulfide reductase [Helicobacter winghamensis]PKT75320.1 polysulfide reductase [Helicobacter winghamensis]PKT82728.1 polysulfide reductase [Helicobacter winghamensis]
MNPIWGPDAVAIIWHWPIAVYLFLAGLSSGAMMTALSVEWMNPEKKAPWDAFVRAGVLLAPVTIIVGLLILVFDLTKPLNFYKLLLTYNLQSVMSLGVLLLLVYTPLSIIYAAMRFRASLESSFLGGLVRAFGGILDFLERHSLWFGRLIFAFAGGVGVYTGFLLSAIQTFPLYNSPILPILFLASGLSSGIAACICFGLLFFEKEVSKSTTKYLLTMDLRVIPIESLLIFALFVGLYFQGGEKAVVAITALSSGSWATIFWLCVIGFSIVIPSVIALTALKNHAYKVNFILLNAASIMIGVFALRMYILYAGQIYLGV